MKVLVGTLWIFREKDGPNAMRLLFLHRLVSRTLESTLPQGIVRCVYVSDIGENGGEHWVVRRPIRIGLNSSASRSKCI